MKTKIFLGIFLVCFFGLCSGLVIETVVSNNGRHSPTGPIIPLTAQTGLTSPSQEQAKSEQDNQNFDLTGLMAIGGRAKAETIIIGSIDKDRGFKFQLELDTRGAAIRTATFSEYNDRDYKEPQPLLILSPVGKAGANEILPMANGRFEFVDQKLQLRLDKINWKQSRVIRQIDGSEKLEFEALVKDGGGCEIVKIKKSYKVIPDSYHLECDITVENLSEKELKTRFDLQGPVGIGREDFRIDARKVVGGFVNGVGQIGVVKLDVKKLVKSKSIDDRRLLHKDSSYKFIWAAVTNKYFAAILRPVPEQDKQRVGWVQNKVADYYDPDGSINGDETVGFGIRTGASFLSPAGQKDSLKTYKFQLYLGPKDRGLFEKNGLYQRLGFIHTIDFLACCCPAAIIKPMAFAIMSFMKWMYGFIHNYGVVIIILVFLVRLAMHPITKKSQVSMSKFSKLAPKIEEIKKRYANDKAEMNRRTMALYKEQGVNPMMSFLPMLVQMPVWIALYSAIYASVDLRGAPFLPVWITDLSAPDALFRFTAIVLPLFGKLDSFNLLPILLGVGMYLQQKLMPTQASTSGSQAAQQQKMMMIMMPIMFPLFLYKAPSGLNLYIMTSIFAGVIEQHIIRKHIREKEAQQEVGLVEVTSKTGGKLKKKKPKPFFRY